jgi:hypothetical protein
MMLVSTHYFKAFFELGFSNNYKRNGSAKCAFAEPFRIHFDKKHDFEGWIAACNKAHHLPKPEIHLPKSFYFLPFFSSACALRNARGISTNATGILGDIITSTPVGTIIFFTRLV